MSRVGPGPRHDAARAAPGPEGGRRRRHVSHQFRAMLERAARPCWDRAGRWGTRRGPGAEAGVGALPVVQVVDGEDEEGGEGLLAGSVGVAAGLARASEAVCELLRQQTEFLAQAALQGGLEADPDGPAPRGAAARELLCAQMVRDPRSVDRVV